MTPGVFSADLLSSIIIYCKFIFAIIGELYTYLAERTETSGKGAFRALQRGFQHWSCGCLNNLELNAQQPDSCHVRCELTPSMMAGLYHVTMILARDGELAFIKSASCECVAGFLSVCACV